MASPFGIEREREMLNEKVIEKVREILSRYNAEEIKFHYDIKKGMEYVKIRDKENRNHVEWVSCCTILLMADTFFRNWRAA